MTLETVTEHASWNHMFVSSSSFPVERGLINVISRSDKIYKQETGGAPGHFPGAFTQFPMLSRSESGVRICQRLLCL